MWIATVRSIGAPLAVGGVYFIAAKLGLRLAFYHPSATPVWPPTGIALAALLLAGYRTWPGIFLGAFAANLTTVGTVWTSLGIATGNTVEGLVGAYLVITYADGIRAFDRPRDFFKFVCFAAVFSTMVAASVGATSLALGGFAARAEYNLIWLTWWLGDATGALVVAPLIILWRTHPRLRWDPPAVRERALFLATLLVIGWVVFSGAVPFAYLTMLPLIWAAFRFDRREIATVIALIAGVAIWATARGVGPFATGDTNASLLVLQTFIGFMALVALPLGVVVMQREAAVKEAWNLALQVQDQNATLEERVRQYVRDLDAAHIEVLERLAAAAEFRDDDTGQHTKRVGRMSAILARHLGLPPEQVELIQHAAPLHDIGKIAVPDRILRKAGGLTPEEFAVVRTHTTIGARILAEGRFPLLRMAEEIARTHHERWDGTGYPHGLKGEAIPLSGRIVALADVFDALTSARSYKPTHRLEEAIAEIQRGAGTLFDPRVVEAFVKSTVKIRY